MNINGVSLDIHNYHRTILDSIPGGMQIAQILYDDQGVPCDYMFLDVNSVFAEIMGLTKEEIIGKTVLDFYPDAEPEWFRKYGEVTKTGQSEAFEMFNVSTDGWYDVLAVPLGEHKFAIVGSDVSKRKEIEKKLGASEELLSTLIDNSRDGLYLFDIRANKFAVINPAQVAITGYTQEESNNNSVEKLSELIHPDDRHLLVEQHKKIFFGADTGFNAEYRCQVKSGEYRWFSKGTTIIRDEKGDPIYLIGISRDVTDRKRAEEALRESTRSFEAAIRQKEDILESISDCFYVLDKDLRFTYVNKSAEQLWGLSRSDLIGRKIVKMSFRA